MDENEVILAVEGQKFLMNKAVLCEKSDYFSAMFSGNFIEINEQEITLDIVDVESMQIITKYVRSGIDVNDLSEFPLSTVGKFAEAANLLQFIELSKIITSYLELQEITVQNWFEIMNIAENCNYTKLKQCCIEFGVPPLKEIKPQYVPTIQELLWYLSQSQLNVFDEYDIFQFALDWMSHSKTDIDPSALLMLLGCLDMKRITSKDLSIIKTLCLSLFDLGFTQSLASKVIDCLMEMELTETIAFSPAKIIAEAPLIKEQYSDQVYFEVLDLAENNRSRQIKYIPVIPVLQTQEDTSIWDRSTWSTGVSLFESPSTSQEWTPPDYANPPSQTLTKFENFVSCDAGYNMHTFEDTTGLDKWLELKIPKREYGSTRYSWSISAWGMRKLVLVISTGKGLTTVASTKIKVYDVLKKEWKKHNEIVPTGMVRRSAVVRDLLFMIGFEDNIVVNLKKKTHKTIAKLPYKTFNRLEIETRMPLICVHNDELYVSNLSPIHRYDEANDEWVKVMDRHISNMVSNDDGYIYVTDAVSNTLCRFRPGLDIKMDVILHCADESDPIINVCALGDRLMFFTNKSNDIDEEEILKRTLTIHEYHLKSDHCELDATGARHLKEVWCQETSQLKFDPYRNVCSLLLDEPTVDPDLTAYVKKKWIEFNNKNNNN